MIQNPQTIARLLQHPGSFGEQRELLLRRLKELVFHDGNAVLLIPEEDAGEVYMTELQIKESNARKPERKFKTIYDAAEWIEKHWPDFDLEATSQVTYRPTRE